MVLNNLDFSKYNKFRKLYIDYKPDGNTLKIMHGTFYKASEIFEDEKLDKIYLQYNKPKMYGNEYFKIYIPVGDVLICLMNRSFDIYTTNDPEFEEQLEDYTNGMKEMVFLFLKYTEEPGFFEYLNDRMEKREYINNALIEALKYSSRPDLVDKYRKYHDDMWNARTEAIRQAEMKANKERKEEKERNKKEFEEKLKEVENEILNGMPITNENVNGKSVLLSLMEKHNIQLPIRTKGFLNNTLRSIQFDKDNSLRYSCYRTKCGAKAKISESCYHYLLELKETIEKAKE